MTDPTPQQAAFDLLADPSTYGGAKVTRIDTHAAAVFLAGEHAYKIKRAVKFPFLDFSTLALRKAALEAEIEANRPFAPQLYPASSRLSAKRRKACARRRRRGRRLGAEDAPLRRDADVRSSRRRRTHRRCDWPRSCPRRRGGAHARAGRRCKGLARGARRLHRAERRGVSRDARTISQRGHCRVDRRRATRRLLACARCCWRAARRGWSGAATAICILAILPLIGGAPLPFDALEFDPIVAAGDVLYDLAFLLMDLVERGLAAPPTPC